MLAQLNVALADASIVAWDAKYHYGFWRPITAIQNAQGDGNDLTTSDDTWAPLLITPPFPEYVSGHSTYSGAAAEVLATVFGGNFPFTTHAIGFLDPNGDPVQRSFASFAEAAEEAGQSRIYGGIHFRFSNRDGLEAGRELANFVLNRFTVATDTQAPKIVLDPADDTQVKTNLTVTGRVLNNLSGVASLQAKLDDESFADVAFDGNGDFAIPIHLPLDGGADGQHTLALQAADFKGNTTQAVTLGFTLDTRAPQLMLTAPGEGEALTASSRLTGSVDPTGSPLTALTYALDGGAAVALLFDPVSGRFDQSLGLSHLTPGDHTLVVTAQDAAGNSSSTALPVNLPAPIPLTVTGFTPSSGANEVGSTFRPQVFFSRPVDPSTLNADNFYATDSAGQKLAATIVPAHDGGFAWLFFTDPMPGASTITVHVDGSSILAAGDGQALDADGDGAPGGTLRYRFTTVNLAPVPGTTLSGRVVDPGPDLKPMTFDDVRPGPDGVLHTDDDVFLWPIAGAKVFIVGRESEAVFTDDQGRFHLASVPVGNVKVAVDGVTATNAPDGFYFPEMVMDATIEVGRDNTLMGSMGSRQKQEANDSQQEVYLPRLRTQILQTVSDTQATPVGVDAESAPNLTEQQRQQLVLQVQPGSLIGQDGQPLSGDAAQVGISTVPPELVRDMLPPGVLQHTFDITIQAPGAAAFNTPLQLTFPNVFNAAPGTKLNFLSFDHTTGRLVIEGTATVSADGLSATTDPGTGITKPGWHGLTPPGTEEKGILESIYDVLSGSVRQVAHIR